MKYEVTITLEVHPEAAFAGTDDEMDNVYSLIDSAVFDLDDLTMLDLEVREHG